MSTETSEVVEVAVSPSAETTSEEPSPPPSPNSSLAAGSPDLRTRALPNRDLQSLIISLPPPAYSRTAPTPTPSLHSPNSPAYSPYSPSNPNSLPPLPLTPLSRLHSLRSSYRLRRLSPIGTSSPVSPEAPPSPPPPPLPPTPHGYHAIDIDIINDSFPPDDEPLPAYSRYPKAGDAGSVRSVNSSDEDHGSLSLGYTRKQRMVCGLYMRTVIVAFVVFVVACVIAGGVLGWQMKAGLQNLPDQSSNYNTSGGGEVDINQYDYTGPGDPSYNTPQVGPSSTSPPAPTKTGSGILGSGAP